MDDIVTKDGIFKYRWYPGFKDILFGKEGCEACSLYNDEYCPKEKCTKDGVYFIMSFDTTPTFLRVFCGVSGVKRNLL